MSWSANDRYLLSGSHDWKVILWDLLDGSRLRTLRFESPIFVAELHPKNHWVFLAAIFESAPVVVDFENESDVQKRTFSSLPKPAAGDEGAEPSKADAKAATIYAQFTPQGTHSTLR